MYVVLTNIDDPHSFYLEARHQLCCAQCSAAGRVQIAVTFEAHHVLEKRHCKMYGAPLYSPDNALRLCAKLATTCHERHTTRQEPVALGALTDANIAFCAAWLEPLPAYEYLRRRYDGEDPRVERLLLG